MRENYQAGLNTLVCTPGWRYNRTLLYQGLEGANSANGKSLGGVVMRHGMVWAILAGLAFALVLSGCGSAAAPGIPTQISSTVGSTPSRTPTAISTPGPLPNDIPVYTGAQLVLAQYIATGALYFYRVMDATQTVSDFYLDQMPQQGWKQTTAQQNGSEGMYLVYTKAGIRSVTMNIVPDPTIAGNTDISMILANS